MKNSILIQPKYEELSDFLTYINTKELKTEIIDLSFPYVLENQKLLDKMSAAYQTIRPYSMHGVFMDINIASNDHDIRTVSREHSRKNFELARELGCKHLIFHTNFFPVMNDKDYLDRWSDMTLEFYAPLSEAYQMNVYLENTLDLYPDALAILMAKAKHYKRIRVCLDIGHLNLSRAPMDEWFCALKDSISYLHYSDNQGRFDDHMAIGSGTVDWEKCHNLIQTYQLTAPVTLEVGSLEQIDKSIDYLKKRSLYPYHNE